MDNRTRNKIIEEMCKLNSKVFLEVLLVQEVAHVRSSVTPRRFTAASYLLVLRYIKLGISRYRRVLVRPLNNNGRKQQHLDLFASLQNVSSINQQETRIHEFLFTFWE